MNKKDIAKKKAVDTRRNHLEEQKRRDYLLPAEAYSFPKELEDIMGSMFFNRQQNDED